MIKTNNRFQPSKVIYWDSKIDFLKLCTDSFNVFLLVSCFAVLWQVPSRVTQHQLLKLELAALSAPKKTTVKQITA